MTADKSRQHFGNKKSDSQSDIDNTDNKDSMSQIGQTK